jgi:hypothetical protein
LNDGLVGNANNEDLTSQLNNLTWTRAATWIQRSIWKR